MDKIVNLYFSTRQIDCDLEKRINELRTTLTAIEISVTLKIHVILKHMADCLQFLNGDELGVWSEQAGESIHRIFLQFWTKYKINIIDDESYIYRLKKAVVDFSSKHL